MPASSPRLASGHFTSCTLKPVVSRCEIRIGCACVVVFCLQPGKYVPVEIDHDAAPLPHPSASQARIIEYKPSSLDEATQVPSIHSRHLFSWLRRGWCSRQSCAITSLAYHGANLAEAGLPLCVQDLVSLILSKDMFNDAMKDFEVPISFEVSQTNFRLTDCISPIGPSTYVTLLSNVCRYVARKDAIHLHAD